MRILYFAWLRAKIGQSEEDFTPPTNVTTLYGLIDCLRARGGGFEEIFADLDVIRVAVDQEYVTGDASLEGVQEIAFFPPVTGG
jgi:molybdopterin synthase sulfur carrier subunit